MISVKKVLQIVFLVALVAGCTTYQELKPSEVAQLVASCTLTDEEKSLIRQSAIKMGMQSCAVMKVMGIPKSISIGEENGIKSGNMLYQFKTTDHKERVLIKLSMDRVLGINVAKLRMFGSSFYPTTVYSFDPAKQIPY